MQPQRTVWIARHGHRIDMADRTWYERTDRPHDPPLSDAGIRQAKDLGRRLGGEQIHHVFASPYERTVETASHVADALGTHIKIEPGVCEWLNVEWFSSWPHWLALSQLCRRYPLVDTGYVSPVLPQYPERWDDLLLRTQATMHMLLEQFTGSLVILGHGASVLGLTRTLIPGAQVAGDLCCLVKLALYDGQWVMELAGDTSHLSDGPSNLDWQVT